MPEPIAWDCKNPRCHNRNPWQFLVCQRCQSSRNSGRPVHDSAANVEPLERYPWLGPAILAGIVIAVLFGGQALLLFAFFALLATIAAGVWRLVEKR